MPNGRAGEIGIAQILPSAHPELTEEEMSDPWFSLKFVIDELKNGNEWKWTNCSCVKFARALGVKIPPKTDAEDIKSNSTPQVGGLVLFKYSNLDHVAVITALNASNFEVREANFKEPCLASRRTVSYQDKAIRGFHTPPLHPTPSLLTGG